MVEVFRMINDVTKTFGENMRALMDKRDVSYRVLARGTGISPSSLHAYAHGTTVPPLPAAKAISTFFGVDLDWMVSRKDSHQEKSAL